MRLRIERDCSKKITQQSQYYASEPKRPGSENWAHVSTRLGTNSWAPTAPATLVPPGVLVPEPEEVVPKLGTKTAALATDAAEKGVEGVLCFDEGVTRTRSEQVYGEERRERGNVRGCWSGGLRRWLLI